MLEDSRFSAVLLSHSMRTIVCGSKFVGSSALYLAHTVPWIFLIESYTRVPRNNSSVIFPGGFGCYRVDLGPGMIYCRCPR